MASMWSRKAAETAPVWASVQRWVGSILVVLVVTAASVSCSGNDSGQAYESDDRQLTTDPSSLMIFDPTIPESGFHGDGIPYCGIKAFTELSEVVFIGRVVGYKERLFTEPSGYDDLLDIYEGIVLQADEVLFGEMPEEGGRITISAMTFMEVWVEGDEKRLDKTIRSIRQYLPGIAAMNSGDGPLYLVYARSAEKGTPDADLNLYWQLVTGVVQEDGSIDLTSSVHFLTTSVCVSSEHGEQEWAERVYTVQDARDAAAFVKARTADAEAMPVNGGGHP